MLFHGPVRRASPPGPGRQGRHRAVPGPDLPRPNAVAKPPAAEVLAVTPVPEEELYLRQELLSRSRAPLVDPLAVIPTIFHVLS
eukprot:CAMPEP_0168469146 /NCGR_PEP_ID=MMETSP0228-20121227/58066_1 /TAXON_ID=133427 /ORGANISM="Protoceratium reticulatum, Strain CCCM 535 (=CCMP 1889)" /LENGTH=83 /DNA_ID=CAMNT_0008484915 /DNA_START=8 /DNA_END=259 /DNA_ORIENTATION=-